MPRRRRVWWLCPGVMSPGFMCLVFMCPRGIRPRKFGATGTTVGTVAKSADSCARRSGSAVAIAIVIVMGGGSAISGVAERSC